MTAAAQLSTRIAALEASARHRPARGLMIVYRAKQRKTGARLLMPTEIEAIRAHMPMRDATLVSVLAYAGLRPGEALALQGQDVELGHIVVSKALSMAKSLRETKTGKSRRVPVVLPLRSDLLQWRFAVGEGTGVKLVFPEYEGNTGTESDWRMWSRRRLGSAGGRDRRERAALRRPAPLLRLDVDRQCAEHGGGLQVGRTLRDDHGQRLLGVYGTWEAIAIVLEDEIRRARDETTPANAALPKGDS